MSYSNEPSTRHDVDVTPSQRGIRASKAAHSPGPQPFANETIQVYARRRQSSREPSRPRARPSDYDEYGDEYARGRQRDSSSSNGPSRQRPSTYDDQGGHRLDTVSMVPQIAAERKIILPDERKLPLSKPGRSACCDECLDNPHRVALLTDDHSDTDTYDSEEEERKERKLRHKKLLAIGLASVTTIAASNSLYQGTIAHKARKKAVADGVMCTSEARYLESKSRRQDMFSLGVAAIALNNCRLGWMRMHNQRKEHLEHVARHAEKRDARARREGSYDDGYDDDRKEARRGRESNYDYYDERR